MKTDKVIIDNTGLGIDQAFAEVEKYCAYHNITGRPALHLRLLAEETLGMVRGIAGDFQADFWLEDTVDSRAKKEKPVCEFHVEARTAMDSDKKEALLAVSSSGKNMAAKGIMGRVRDAFSNCLMNYGEAVEIQNEMGIDVLNYESGFGMAQNPISCVWSLNQYREQTRQEHEKDDEAWDELEKSIVARLASEVLVGVRGNKAELIVYKKYSIKSRV